MKAYLKKNVKERLKEKYAVETGMIYYQLLEQ